MTRRSWETLFLSIGFIIGIIALIAVAITLLGAAPAATLALGSLQGVLLLAMLTIWLVKL